MLRFALLSFALLGMSIHTAHAGDASQFRGPNRDGQYDEKGLLKTWPEGGPTRLWEVNCIGKGYASPSVVDGTIYVPGMLDANNGYLFALDMNGKELWRLNYGAETEDSQAPGARSTLTVDGPAGYLISGLGVVYKIDLPGHKVAWQVDMMERFRGEQIQWTIAESPLVDDKYVYCTPGGPDASIAALDKRTGETVWTTKGLSDKSAYCSPNIIVHNGHRILVTMTARLVVGVNPDTGAVLWTHEHPTDYDIHASTPVYADGKVYFVAGSKSGGGVLELSEDGSKAALKWSDTQMDTFHGGVVLKNGYIYGTAHESAREMLCLALDSGKIMWRTPEVTESAIVYADGMLYSYEGPKSGRVNLIRATPDGFERAGQFKITQGTAKHWAHPVIAGGRLYIRRGEYLWAYDVAEK